jgi:hypothetical protein
MRCASQVTDVAFPFADDRVPFILVYNLDDGQSALPELDGDHFERGFAHASTGPKKVALLHRARELEGEGVECSVLATWPGAKRTDVFHVDDIEEALAAFG